MKPRISFIQIYFPGDDSRGTRVAERIDRPREYRSSLTAAAVAGQFDIGTFKAEA